ncbi:L-threonylcarbamoyladenylate synthase [Brachybacterium paraconglomeratum]|uniref:L-threonylcarbamoyladenylate synthase n=1 Tax=Brachybacterium paraconglomeratum TaxID=173362 RepID=UPI0031EE1D44
MSVHDTQNPEAREEALAAAVDAVRGGELIVLPTDTVYGIGADAFTPEAVEALLEAKGRGRDTPPPVLIGDHAVLLALATDLPDYVEDLVEELWPGALTLILTAQPSLTWDLGETRGTVALRMPEDEVALELLRRTGPLAVSSANRHGKPAANSVLDAATQLGDSVAIYLDGGPARIGASSTILDTTVTPAEIVREGAISQERIIEVVGDIFTAPEPEADPEDDAKAVTEDAAAVGEAEATDEGSADITSAASDDSSAAGDSDVVTASTPDVGGDAAPGDIAPGDTAPGANQIGEPGEAPSPSHTSVLNLPSEPEQSATSTELPLTETSLDGIGEASAVPGDSGTQEGPAENTPG